MLLTIIASHSFEHSQVSLQRKLCSKEAVFGGHGNSDSGGKDPDGSDDIVSNALNSSKND